MTTDAATGRYLARLRDDAGLKQNELAQKVTWSPAVLSRVESGERSVTPDELTLILAAIGTPEASEFQQSVGRVWQRLPKPPLGHPDESLLWDAETAIGEIESLLENPEIKYPFANRLVEFKEELRNAARLVHNTEYTVAMVGDIGVGKSTAICRVSGLEVQAGKTTAPTPVLEVGGGGVTICEVHLVQGIEYGLLVEPMGEQEIQREVREFANVLKEAKALPQANGAPDPVFGTSKELERAIRNMSGLTKKRIRQTGPDGKIRRVSDDPAKTLAKDSRDTSTLATEILARMNLRSRNKRQLQYSAAHSNKSPLRWLKDCFELLNNGRHPEFSIPRRVEIVLPQPILGEKLLSIRLVDTKGIDDMVKRADIDRLFSDPDTVVVMCSIFNAIPSPSVQSILERSKDGRFANVNKNAAVLGLPRQGEALAVKHDDGYNAESIDDGYELKLDQAQAKLRSIGAPELRVGFFNAFEDDPIHLRDLLLNLVNDLRLEQRSKLVTMIEDSHWSMDHFEQEQTLEVQRLATRRLSTWLTNNNKLDFSACGEPEQDLMNALNENHASSIQASIRRRGIWYNFDYRHRLGYGARLMGAQVVGRKLDSFEPVVDNLLQDEQVAEAFGLLRQARRVMSNGIEELLKKCDTLGKDIHASDMQFDPELWLKCNSEWGQGPGYRKRVKGHHRDWFSDHSDTYGERLRSLIEKEWQATTDRLARILEDGGTLEDCTSSKQVRKLEMRIEGDPLDRTVAM